MNNMIINFVCFGLVIRLLERDLVIVMVIGFKENLALVIFRKVFENFFMVGEEW